MARMAMPRKVAWASRHAGSFDILSRPAKQSQSDLARAPISVFALRFEITPFAFIHIVG